MGRVHFIGGEKGGVGKSLTARLLAQYFIDRGETFVGFDLYKSHGTFSRFYSEFAAPVDVDDFTSLDAIVAAAEAQPDVDIIVDLAAQTFSRLDKWIADGDIFALLNSLGCEVFLWHVMDDGADSLRLLDKLIAAYGQYDLQLVVVRNMGRGEDFSIFDASASYQQLQQRRAEVVTLAKLHTLLAQKIDFNNHSFWAAANSLSAMSTIERQRVRVWLKAHNEQFDRFLRRSNEV
jgi:hypothetical protein